MLSEAAIALLLVAALVILINGALLLFARRSAREQSFRVWGQALDILKNPWEQEDKDLEELHRLVSGLDESEEEE